MKRKVYALAMVSLLTLACGHTKEEVVLAHPDGSRMVVRTVKGSGAEATCLGETRYYDNGKKQYEKHFAADGKTPDGDWKYFYDDGKLFATARFDQQHPMGSGWRFLNHEGKNLFSEDYDTLRVLEMSEMMTPATVELEKGEVKIHYQFFSNGTLRSKGNFVNGRREGHWVFYHATGQVQSEGDYINGREEGLFSVYHENGVPFYRGNYRDGQRTGTWEFYDNEGKLTNTKQF